MRCEAIGREEMAGLEIHEDLPTQGLIWRFERIGWAGLTLFVLAGLLGAFGGGSLSRAEARDASGRLAVRFERFARADTSTTLEIRVVAAQQGEPLWLNLSKNYFDAARIDRIVPEPERTVVTQDAVRFGFDPNQAGESGLIIVTLTPVQFGRIQGSLGLASGPAVQFVQIVYP